MPLFINLPAKSYQHILAGCADVQLHQAQQGQGQQGQKRIEITIRILQRLSVSQLIKSGSKRFSWSPVRPHVYALRTEWQVLKDKCTELKCDICAFIAEDDNDISYVRWGRPLVIYLVPSRTDVKKRDDLYVLMPYSFQQQPGKYLRPYVIYLPRDVVKHSGGSVLGLGLRLKLPDSEEVEFADSKALVIPAREVSVYPAWLALEVSVDRQGGSSGSVSRLSSLLNLVYLGSTVVARGEPYVQLPGVVMYDVAGWNLPQLTSSAEGIEVRASVRFDELVRWLFSSNLLDALAKVLVNNIVAQTAAALCGIKKKWIFERIVSTSAAGHDVWLSSPMLGNVLRMYRTWMGKSSLNVQSVISIYVNTLLDILRSTDQCNRKLNSIMSNLIGTSGGQTGLQQEVAVLRNAVAVTALMLGGHGVAHIIARALGAASAGTLGETVEVKLKASYVRKSIENMKRLNGTLGGTLKHTFLFDVFHELESQNKEVIYNGVFLLKAYEELEHDAEVSVRIYHLRGLPHVPSGADLQPFLQRRVADVLVRDGRDRCNEWYWEEEKRRLQRAWTAIKRQYAPELIDKFMSNLPSMPQPPRDVFRFLLRDLLEEIYQRNQQTLSQDYHTRRDFVRAFLRGSERVYLQYIWPRYVKYCNDGCHLCVRLVRGACVMPPVQEALYTSKHIAKYILHKAGLLQLGGAL